MKSMKKVIALVMALCMVFALAACSSEKAPADKGDKGETKEKLIMATNAAFPPYEFVDDNGEFAGIDVEIAQAIADKLNMELEIKDVEFGSIIGGVQSGKFDIGVAGMTVTDERLESVNFSTSYAKGIQSVIVKEDCKYKDFSEFYSEWEGEGDDAVPKAVNDDIAIGVQQDTTGDIYSSDKPENWGFGADRVTQFKTGAEAVQALVTGKVMAVIIDNEPAKSFVAANEGLKILDGAYTEEDYAIAIAKDNTELLEKVNKALAELTADGTIQKIIDKYIPAD